MLILAPMEGLLDFVLRKVNRNDGTGSRVGLPHGDLVTIISQKWHGALKDEFCGPNRQILLEGYYAH